MSLLLVPATRDNLEKSIEKSVDISFAKKFLELEFINEIIRISGIEGIRCWALTKNRLNIFNDLKVGDEVLFTEKKSGLFTHYGIVIGKTQNVEFGTALWPIVGESPWENIYFLANTTKIKIDKAKLVSELGYAQNYVVPGAIKVDDKIYERLGAISKLFEIQVYQHVAEVNVHENFYSENIEANGMRRKGHAKFSKIVKNNYKYACAVCGITESEFLIAGHISSWSEDPHNRLNPENGICLCALHDKAFEHGYISISDKFEVLISKNIEINSILYQNLIQYANKKMFLPDISKPNINLIIKHREKYGFN